MARQYTASTASVEEKTGGDEIGGIEPGHSESDQVIEGGGRTKNDEGEEDGDEHGEEDGPQWKGGAWINLSQLNSYQLHTPMCNFQFETTKLGRHETGRSMGLSHVARIAIPANRDLGRRTSTSGKLWRECQYLQRTP